MLRVRVHITIFILLFGFTCQQPPPVRPPLNQVYQVECQEDIAYSQPGSPALAALLQEFVDHAPPGFVATQVFPEVHTGVNAHRLRVHYRSQNLRQCEDKKQVFTAMNAYKPQNAVVGEICVIPGGWAVEYFKYCVCRRQARQKRQIHGAGFFVPPLGYSIRDTVAKYRGEGRHSQPHEYENAIERPPAPRKKGYASACSRQCH